MFDNQCFRNKKNALVFEIKSKMREILLEDLLELRKEFKKGFKKGLGKKAL